MKCVKGFAIYSLTWQSGAKGEWRVSSCRWYQTQVKSYRIFSRPLFRAGNSCITPQFRVSYRAKDNNSLLQCTHKWAIELNSRREIPYVHALMYIFCLSHDMFQPLLEIKERIILLFFLDFREENYLKIFEKIVKVNAKS